jgi:hypothetical protein
MHGSGLLEEADSSLSVSNLLILLVPTILLVFVE